MGEMNPENMLNCDDKELITEINKAGNRPDHSAALQMAGRVRNANRLAGAIYAASNAGRFLAWVGVAVAAVGALATLLQTCQLMKG